MPKTVFINAVWKKDLRLSQDLLDTLKDKKSVALFASVQFLALDIVKKQLEDAGISVNTTKAKRTHAEVQVLGCDAYADVFDKDIISESDAILYIGDGLFHPKALLLAQMHMKEPLDVLIWDPVSEKMRVLTQKEIEYQKRKMKANIVLFVAAQTIGVMVSTKPGQQFLKRAQELKEKLDAEGKNVYIFIDDTLDLSQLENYPFIDVWVNTACPRIGTDDILGLEKPLVNIREAFDPIKALEKFEQ